MNFRAKNHANTILAIFGSKSTVFEFSRQNHANTILAIFGAKIQYQKYQLQRNNYKQTALKSKQIAEKCKQKAVKK